MRVKRKIDNVLLWLVGAFGLLGMALAPWFVFCTYRISYQALSIFFFLWDLPLIGMSCYLFFLALPVIELDISSGSLIVIKNFLGLKIKKEYLHIRKIYYCRKMHRGRHNSFPVNIIYLEEEGEQRLTLLNSMVAENIDDIYHLLESHFHNICIDERESQSSE